MKLNHNIKLSEEDPSLFCVNDVNSGLLIYYFGETKKELFTGTLYEKFNNKIISEYEVKNGRKNGIQRDYFQDGKLEEISEWKENFKYGINKEYNDEGILKSVSIVWNNDYIKIMDVEKQKVIEKKIINKEGIPGRILYLLNLSDRKLLDYSFDMKNSSDLEEDYMNGFNSLEDHHTTRNINL